MPQSLLVDGQVFNFLTELDEDNPFSFDRGGDAGTTGGWVRWTNSFSGGASGYIYKPTDINVRGGQGYGIMAYGTGYYSRTGFRCNIRTEPWMVTNSRLKYETEPAGFVPDCTKVDCTVIANFVDGTSKEIATFKDKCPVVEVIDDCLFKDCESLADEVLSKVRGLNYGL